MRLTGTGVWHPALRYGDPGEIADAAAELEALGYTCLWIPDPGGEVFDAAERLLSATKTITVATGVLNLWMHPAEETASAYARLVSRYGERLVVGIGVSHASLIEPAFGPGSYREPLRAMASFLDGLDTANPSLPPRSRVLAALGPRMLELARDRAAGAHPFNTSPAHTAMARAALGPSPLLVPEQAVVASEDDERGRQIARQYLARYLELPNYVNNFRRLGFGDDDFADGPSDRLVEAVVVWGDEDTIAARIGEHRHAGADHVCVHVIGTEGMPRASWRALAPALASR